MPKNLEYTLTVYSRSKIKIIIKRLACMKVINYLNYVNLLIRITYVSKKF